ncbi:sulfatase [Acidobacteriota bacterium]
MMISNLSPKAIDGVLNLHMNHIAQDDLLIGQWSAPRLGRDKKFYRSALAPHSGISFHVLKKEAFIVDVDLSEVVPSLMIQINEREFLVSGHRFRGEIAANDVQVGKNKILFLFSDRDRIDVKQIQIHPKRFQKFANKITPGSDFLTPVQFHYYCNPLKGSQLNLSFIFQGQKPINGKITVESEKSKKEYMQTIHSRKSFKVSLVDETLHHILIEIPEVNSPYIRLTESKLIEPSERTSPLTSLQDMAKDKNILVILLDAARADHMSCYGYDRQTTPHIDRLSENGFRFNDVFVEAAYTLASTGTLLTGLPPDVHGVISAFYSSLSDDITTLPELLQDKGYLTAALSANPFFSSAYNYQQGFDHFIELFDERKVVNGEDFVAPFEKLVTEVKNKPFFMYLHLREPHTPYSMPRPFFGKYQKNFESPSDDYYKEIKRIFSAESRSLSELQFMTDVYDENLAYADHIVGKFIEVLKRAGRFDETITIIISDHGEGLGEHELLGHNVILHREGIHVPLIFYLPGHTDEPKVIDDPAITSDLAVTLCELLDVDYPYPEFSRGSNLFYLPAKRIRICRSTVMSSRYSGYVVDSFPFRAIIFPKLGQLNTQVFDVNEDPDAAQIYSNGDFQEAALEFFLSRFIVSTTKGFRAGEKPKLGEKEKERLKALGYIE